MATAKITLASFYTWFDTAVVKDDLFKNLELPEGIDKDTLVGNILMRGGEFEVMYSDPNFLQNLIGIWSKKWYRTFDKWVKALAIEYSPLENYDRMEEWSETRNNHGSETTSGTLGRTTSDGGTSENKVSAYDSSTYQPAEYTTVSNTGSVNDTTSGSSSTNFGEGIKHESKIHGNIGVTTSQQMLESELQIAEWNLYEHITDLFLSEFVIPIYS